MWAQFGGEIDWSAVPWIAEMKGCNDLDTLCELLLAIRAHRFEAMKSGMD